MNPITDLIFTVSWFALLVFAIRSILTGWSTTPRRVHPEMKDVKDGEELMGVTFKSCDIDDYNELQERINQIQNKLQDTEDN